MLFCPGQDAGGVEENVVAVDLKLSVDDLLRINKAMPPGVAAGTRYPETMMKVVGR